MERSLTPLLADSHVYSAEGRLPASVLYVGDRIVTRDAGMVRVRSVARRIHRCACVAVAAGCMGHNRPEEPLTLPADTPVLVRDWRAMALYGQPQVLLPAARLVDGQYVRDIGIRVVETVTLDLGAPHIVYIDGLEVASAAQASVIG
ncbi:MAG: Hint domain-containing protein [Roseivivax sp.]|nr:Hint domain-containing protein [Roseivivax sp.]